MKLYLECAMGAAGDMLMSALYELLPNKEMFREKMENLNLPNVTFEYKTVKKSGISGTKIAVKVGGIEEKSEDEKHDHLHSHAQNAHHEHDHDHNHDHKHAHSHEHLPLHLHSHGNHHKHSHPHPQEVHSHNYSYAEIKKLIGDLDLPDNILKNALGVYKILGGAEAAVHGETLEKIHFHEVGSLDAIADIVGCCIAVEMLGVTEITASPVHVGYGTVRCEHGLLPIPAPAAAEILKGIPIYSGSIEGELCTPTGAALLKKFVKNFSGMPPMAVKTIGYGMGAKEFEAVNCIRAFLYEDDVSEGGDRGMVCEISCNLDDMTPEAVGAAFDLLLEHGALDVTTTPIMMKKSRQAIKLTCLCKKLDRDKFAKLILEHTTTLGVRISEHRRDTMTRTMETVQTAYGSIRIKIARGFGVTKLKPEYDDVLTASKKHGIPFHVIYDAALQASPR